MQDFEQLEVAKARAYNMKTPPGQMFGPAWKAVPSVVVVDAQERGARSHSGIVSSGWELSTLRLLWDINRGWNLHQGYRRRQIKRCHGTLSWRVACGSLGSARAISGRGTGLNPGPESMPSKGANHGERLATATGKTQQLRG